ncbi:SH3 and PX domain-containing protein 2A-like isoform X2 [Ylistrum balloti]|uniref:SH3 and PX domain-containing protein 2A-like isoform X2 n=1 Tax=Ylistrum balloti TaxID=509963 RepID=UPI002905B814|nr:SH3 and PX domain-containing protein 2A-like isoform X2 [Ylistrum balloti]
MQRKESRWVTEISVPEVEKRRIPSKHYVYIIMVTWSDHTTTTLYRRYSRFFDFQNELLDKFPLEAGLLDPMKRIIPFLPGKIYFGRSHIRDVALKRLKPINDYCKALIALPEKISHCEDVLDFFDVGPEDIAPVNEKPKMKKKNQNIEKISGPKLAEEYVVIGDYTKEDKWDLNLKAGMVVQVVEKSESGWWFVTIEDHQGWVPSTYLKRKDGLKENTTQRLLPGEEEKFTVTEAFYPSNEDEIALELGTVVDVLEKNLDGWWLVRYLGKEGWAPATYLMKAEKAHIQRTARQSGVQVVGTLSDISDIMSRGEEEQAVGGMSGAGGKTRPLGRKLRKQKSGSLERGGSIRPPPRQNSIKNIQLDVTIKEAKSQRYITISDFSDTVGDGISFKRGQEVLVSEKTDGGWWFGEINGTAGWIPSSYIQEISNDTIDEEDSVYHEVPGSSDEGDSKSDPEDDEWYQEVADAKKPEHDEDYLEPMNKADPEQIQLKKPLPDPSNTKSPVRPVLPLPKSSSSPSQQDNDSDVKGSVSQALKSRFENEKTAVPSRPFTPPRDNRVSSNYQNQEDERSSNLANVLKARFEKRQSAANEEQKGTPDNNNPSNSAIKKQPLLPPVKPKVKSASSPKDDNVPKPNGKPLPSKTHPPIKPLKPALPLKEPTKTDSSSDLKSVLAAKFQARNSGAVLAETRNSPEPPPVGRKQAVKQQGNDEKDDGNVSTSDLKSKFETMGIKKPTPATSKPKPQIPVQSGPQFRKSKPLVPEKKILPKTAMKPKPPVSTKPVPNPTSVPEKNKRQANVKFVATADFEAENDGEISFRAGDSLSVKQQLDTGWWLVTFNGNEGWAPATYLQEL